MRCLLVVMTFAVGVALNAHSAPLQSNRPHKWRISDPAVANALIAKGGRLVADYGKYLVYPDAFAKDFKAPAPSIPKSIGHHKEWTEAIKGNGKTTCHFDYSGGLTEAVLLGNVSHRAKALPLEWDADKAKTTSPAADLFLGKEYRKGWELPKA